RLRRGCRGWRGLRPAGAICLVARRPIQSSSRGGSQMKRFTGLLGTLALVAVLGAPWPVVACPACAGAVAAHSTDAAEERLLESRAFNNSIYLFVSMPSLLLAALGFMVYRGSRNKPRQCPPPASANPAAEGDKHVLATEPPTVREPGADRR